MLGPGKLETWRASLRRPPRAPQSTARGWVAVRASGGSGKKPKKRAGDSGGRGNAADATLPPGAPPPPPTVAPPPPKITGPVQRSSYRRPRRTIEEIRAEREAQDRANAEAAQGITRWLNPEQLAEAAAAATAGSDGVRVGGGALAVQPGRLIIVDGYNYLNASPRYAPLVRSGRLEAARNALHAALTSYARPITNSTAAVAPPTVIVVYDAMSNAAPRRGGGPAAVAADRAVREAMDRVAARFPPHSVPSAHRLREMALEDLGLARAGSGSSGNGREEVLELAPNVTAVFSRACEADTWILDEIDSVAARWQRGSSSIISAGRRLPGDVVVVSDDRRIQDGVLYTTMDLIERGADGSSGSGNGIGDSAAGLSLAAWPCSRFDGEVSGSGATAAASGSLAADARRAASGGGAAAAAAAAAWARGGGAAAGAFGGGIMSSGAESDAEGDWADGDYDDAGLVSDLAPQGPAPTTSKARASKAAAAPLTPDAVNELLSSSGDALAAADASLEALLGVDLGLGGGDGSGMFGGTGLLDSKH